jgi:mRNA interferase HigB
MKVHLIRKETIEHFARQNARSRSSFQEWLTKLKYADWENPEDIQATFSSADLLGNGSDRVVFDIGGNNYRMICKYWFGTTRIHIYVKWIGAHGEYNGLCKRNRQYTVDDF